MTVQVPLRDKKMVVWNFMEELWSKHQIAVSNRQLPVFSLSDFNSIGLFEDYLPVVGVEYSRTDSVILQALHEYQQRGYYEIQGNTVSLTKYGLELCQKSHHDWD